MLDKVGTGGAMLVPAVKKPRDTPQVRPMTGRFPGGASAASTDLGNLGNSFASLQLPRARLVFSNSFGLYCTKVLVHEGWAFKKSVSSAPASCQGWEAGLGGQQLCGEGRELGGCARTQGTLGLFVESQGQSNDGALTTAPHPWGGPGSSSPPPPPPLLVEHTLGRDRGRMWRHRAARARPVLVHSLRAPGRAWLRVGTVGGRGQSQDCWAEVPTLSLLFVLRSRGGSAPLWPPASSPAQWESQSLCPHPAELKWKEAPESKELWWGQ